MCRICNTTQHAGLTQLVIVDCPALTVIPIIQDLTDLDIHNCPLITKISNMLCILEISKSSRFRNFMQKLTTLYIMNCPLLTAIPHIQGLTTLYIDTCPKLTVIPNIQGLTTLGISNCLKLKDTYQKKKKRNIKQYIQRLTAIRIINWYRKCKRNKVLWKIAEYYTKRKYSPENILKFINLKE